MAELHVGAGQTYATFAAAFAMAGNGDEVIAHATGGAPTPFDEITYIITQTSLIIRAAADSVGLITVRPNANMTSLWEFRGDAPVIRDLLFHHNSKAMTQLFYVNKSAGGGCINGVIEGCTFAVPVGDYCIHAGNYSNTGWAITDCVFGGAGSGIDAGGLTGTISGCAFSLSLKAIDSSVNAGLVIDGCVFHGAKGTSIAIEDCRNGVIVKNSIFYTLLRGIEVDAACAAGGVYNNVFYDCTYGISTGAGQYPHAVDNNAFASCTEGIYGNTSTSAPAPSNNLFYGNTRDYYSYTAPAASQLTDPQFTDAPAGDFTWPKTSPLKDHGKLLAGIVDFDILGISRPQGTFPDIGPYELTFGGIGGLTSWCGFMPSLWNGIVISSWNGV